MKLKLHEELKLLLAHQPCIENTHYNPIRRKETFHFHDYLPFTLDDDDDLHQLDSGGFFRG